VATVVPNYSYSLTIYNSAGEVVRTVASGEISAENPANDFGVQNKVYSGATDGITAGGKTFPWAGVNDSGQKVQNGTYYVQLEAKDNFGRTVTYTQQITVLVAEQTYTVRIFNSAGEEVNMLVVSGYAMNAPSRLLANKNTVAVGQATGSAGQVVFDLGNGSTVTWDGTNAQGARVASGAYVVQLVVTHEGSPKTITSTTVSVINVAEGLLSHTVIGPNPLYLGTTAGISALQIQLNSAPGLEATAFMYSLTGELVVSANNQAASDRFSIDLSGRQPAAGVYIISLSAKAPWGTVERKNLKLVIVR
jgi:flagellar hook assembly protein FlgD